MHSKERTTFLSLNFTLKDRNGINPEAINNLLLNSSNFQLKLRWVEKMLETIL